MARTNASGWLATRVALAAATLVAGGAIVASTSSFIPQVALAEEVAAAEQAPASTVEVQVSGTFYLDSAQSVVEGLQASRAEGSELVETQALDAKAQERAAQYAYSGIHSAQSADECVTYLGAADAADPAAAVAGMTTDWYTQGSALNNTDYGFFGIALFQAQNGDLYLVAVFSNEAGNMGEASQFVQAVEGSGMQEDGTEVGVPATLTVTVTSQGENEVDPQKDPAEVTFTFDANGGEGTMESLTGVVEAPICTFTPPEGMQFECWSETSDGSGASWEAGDMLSSTENKTLYAIWEDVPVATADLTFVGNGANTVDGAQTVFTETIGDAFTMPTASDLYATPEGQHFKCWGVNREGLEATYAEGESYTVEAPQTFYAIWEQDAAATTTITFNPNGGSGNMDAITDATIDEAYVLPNVAFTAPEGKQFKCWALDPEGQTTTYENEGIVTPGEGGLTLYAIWEDVPVATADLTFVGNGANTVDGAQTVFTETIGDAFTMPTASDLYATPEGQHFKCWGVNREGLEATYAEGESYTVEAPQTFYAIWEQDAAATTTITFNPNGGSGNMDAITDATIDEAYVLPNVAFTAPEGKQFKCWALDPEGQTTTYENEGIVTPGEGGLTLYAIWEDVPVTAVSINFDANGGSGMMESVSAELNSNYTVPGCSFTAPAGKQFKCWSSNREGNAPIYQQDDTFTVESETTLYAIWEDAPVSQVTVSFNANGGTGSMSDVTVDLGSSTTLPKATFTRSGYVFAGWNTKADGTGSSFADGANITPGANVTLYAKWNQTKYINGIQNNLKVTTTVGTKPTLPTTAMVRWSDSSTSSESVVWTEPDNYQSLYSAVGSFQVTGTVQGHSVKCTVNVVAASDNSGNNGTNSGTSNGTTYSDVSQDQASTIAKTGDETDYTPIAIAAGVGVVVVILAVALILKSRKK